jgi:hypothetical protein
VKPEFPDDPRDGVRYDVVQAYNRTTMLERRKPVYQAWNDFLDGKVSAKVVPMPIGKRS